MGFGISPNGLQLADGKITQDVYEDQMQRVGTAINEAQELSVPDWEEEAELMACSGS